MSTKKGHGIDTGTEEDLDALRPSMVNPLSAEERAAATERRKKRRRYEFISSLIHV
jgi:hypothetical protein